MTEETLDRWSRDWRSRSWPAATPWRWMRATSTPGWAVHRGGLAAGGKARGASSLHRTGAAPVLPLRATWSAATSSTSSTPTTPRARSTRAEHEVGDQWIVQACCYFAAPSGATGATGYFVLRDEDFFYNRRPARASAGDGLPAMAGAAPKHAPGMMLRGVPAGRPSGPAATRRHRPHHTGAGSVVVRAAGRSGRAQPPSRSSWMKNQRRAAPCLRSAP